MSGPIHGSIEHLFLGTTAASGSAQSCFINVYNFFNNNTGSLGIQRIAYHTGSKTGGMTEPRAMNFYDSAQPAGDNAWACFAFTSASVPWYVLIQWTGNTNTFGSSPGSPGLLENVAVNNGFAIAFAQRADGGNPWNGSSGSNGMDTKGTPVWHPGTSSLVLYPRSNDGVRAGAHSANKQNMMGFTTFTNVDYRLQQVADYDNFALLLDIGNDNSYAGVIFGQYTALSGVNPQVPYVCFKDAVTAYVAGTQYGPPAGTSTTQGGIAYPTVSISGTCAAGIDRYGTTFFQSTAGQPNRAFAVPVFDEFPLLVGLNEQTNQVGATGQIYDFFREVYNVSSQDTNNDGTRACFGNTTIASIKLSIPWASGTVPGIGVTRTGVSF